MKFQIELEDGLKETDLLMSTQNVCLFAPFRVSIVDSKPFLLKCISFYRCTSKVGLLYDILWAYSN